MWTPAFASLVARTALREGIRDVSFRFGGRSGARMTLVGWLFPLAVGAVAYGVAWSTGLATFRAAALPGLPRDLSPAAAFAVIAGVQLTLGTVLGTLSAAGEEIGWRGYMLTRLVDAGVPRPVLASGLIWGAWHLPMILGGAYAAGARPAVSALVFIGGILPMAVLLARLRLESGSVWPAVVGHAAWNATIQGAFDASTVPGASQIWVGESGVLVAAASAGVVYLLVRGKFPAGSP
jgi:membrane protease YdiL (CAAX protease family)